MKQLVLYRLIALVLLLLIPQSPFALGQELTAVEMPVGWQSFDAEVFTASAEIVLKGDQKASQAHQQEIIAHAWETFLADDQFIASGDFATVMKMISLFGDSSLISGRPEGDIQSLLTRANARLDTAKADFPGMDLYALCDSAKALRKIGRTDLQSAPLFKDWMAVNEWRALESKDLYNLFGFVNADSLDRRKFSARWTGSVTVPVSGNYVFRQPQVYLGVNSQLKLWINEKLILDSTSTGSDIRFESEPISLTVGVPVSIQLDLVHETETINYSVGAPMALVTWQCDGGDETIIPSSALSPPASLIDTEESGLQGEYFRDVSFSDLCLSRLDPTLDLIWTWPPAASAETEATRQVMGEIVDRLLDDSYLNDIATGEEEKRSIEFDRNLWRLVYRMSGTDRSRLIETLKRNATVLEKLTPEPIGRMFRGVYMLPGDAHLELLGEWALANPHPRCQPGSFPGWQYKKLNTDFYWAIGYMLQGPYWEDAETLRENYLERPNGECNLRVAYALAYAAETESSRSVKPHGRELRKLIEERLEDERITGDVRVTWLVAYSFLKEIQSTREEPQLLRGKQYLQEAMLVAETNEYRFWAFQELVARYASLGATAAVDRFIQDFADQFTSPTQVQAMADWKTRAAELAAEYKVAQQAHELESELALTRELERRLAQAQEYENQVDIGRYQQLLENTETDK